MKKKRSKLLFCEALPLFLDIASDTLAKVRRDRDIVPPRLRSMLVYIERRLFLPRLSASRMYEDCDVKDRSISTHFRRALGTSPWRYIESCRMDVGERLLRETNIKITWISAMLGYASLKVFSNAFGRRTSERPLTYRKMSQSIALEKDLAKRPPEELDRIVMLRRALAGTLPADEAEELIEHLRSLYPKPGEATRAFEL